MKIGDKVRLIGIPPDTHDGEELQTRTLFEKCLGKTFAVAGLETVEGLPHQLVQLDVGHILGEALIFKRFGSNPNVCDSKRPSKSKRRTTLKMGCICFMTPPSLQ